MGLPPRAPLDPLTGLSAARFAVYVHFPYCLSKCPYCDFASAVAKQIPEERYAQAVTAELALRLREEPALADRPVDAVFFGGGTPSLWAPKYLVSILDALAKSLKLASGAEVTLEANPDAADAERFRGFRAAGVNRLSIGVQSFEASTLAFLGRAHDGPTAERAYRSARAAGFENVSMDFIYGVPGQSVAQADRDAAHAASLQPEHLSAYALTLEKEALAEEVPLAKQLARGEVQLPADEQVVAMSRAVTARYAQAGLERYEISNYAKPGFHSRHNCLYWTGGEYLALGAGATGYLQASATYRYSNHRGAERYLEAVARGARPEASREPLGTPELLSERLAMGLRLTNGIDLEQACASFGQPAASRAAQAQWLLSTDLAEKHGARLALTPRGMDLHSAICARLI